ncbi:MAG: glycosyl hydrolase family 28-related protein [Actinomycetota bacterium]
MLMGRAMAGWRRRRHGSLVLALALGLATVGCGAAGGDVGDVGDAAERGTPSPTTTAATTTTRPTWLAPIVPETPAAIGDQLAIASWSVAGTTPIEPTRSLSVDEFGAVADDDRSDSAAFAAAVAAARALDGPVLIEVPTGTYHLTETLRLDDGITLRGAGPASQLVLEVGDAAGISATGTAPDTWNRITAAPRVGDVRVEVDDPARYRPGDLVELEQDNDPDRMYTRPEWQVAWGAGSVGELNRVLDVDVERGALLLLSPLNADYDPRLSPRIRPVDPVEQVGVESLSVFRRDEGYGSTIRFELAADVWVDEVVSRRTSRAHVGMNQVYRCRVEDSILHDATDFGDGGRAYGVSLARHATGCLVVNNTLYDLRHAIIVQLGASGNVIGYNHARGSAGYEDRQPRADLSLHGHWAQANLFEGNIVDRAVSSDWWGPSGPANTLYRNCVRDHVIVTDGSDAQVVVGNVVGPGGLTVDDDIADTVAIGNLVIGPTAGPVAGAGGPATFPPSLWTTTAPDFLEGFAWPPIDPATTGDRCDLPASERSPLGNR